MMRIDLPRTTPFTPQEQAENGLGEIRILAGKIPDLNLGERVKVFVIQAADAAALVNLKGAEVNVSRLAGMKPGAEIVVRVAAVSPQPLLRLEAVVHSGSSQMPPLAVGQTASATVLRLLSADRLLLHVEGALVETNNPGGVSAGESLRVRVDRLLPQVVLHIVDQEPDIETEALRLLRTQLPGRASVDSLTNLQNHLASHPALREGVSSPSSVGKLHALISAMLPDQSLPTPESLAAFVRDGGLHYEAKLFRAALEGPQAFARVATSDLKGLLLGALEEISAAPPAGDLRAAILSQLGQVEAQQAANLLAQLRGEPYQLQLPLLAGLGWNALALSIERDAQDADGKPEKREAGFTVLFLLDLENFGRVRIDARIGTETLRVIFYAEQESSLVRLDDELPAFHETLQAMGYREVLLAAKPLKDIPPEKEPKFAALALGASPGISLLDVKA